MPIPRPSHRWPRRLVVQAPLILLAVLSLLVGFGCGSEDDVALMLTFSNATEAPVEIFWVDKEGEEQSDGLLEPGQVDDFDTYATEIWRFKQDGRVIGTYEAGSDLRQFHLITGTRSVSVEAPADETPRILGSLDFESSFEDPNIVFRPDGFILPNVHVTMWSKDVLYNLDTSSEFILDFDATLTDERQELIIAFSQNKIPWGAEGADALTFRVSPSTQDVWFRTGFYESWLNPRLYYNSSEKVIQVDQAQQYRIRLTPSNITVFVDHREIAGATFDVASVPRSGYVGFVVVGSSEIDEAAITYQHIAVSEKRRSFTVVESATPEPTTRGRVELSSAGRSHMLVIAVEAYIDAEITDLDFPIQDAEKLVQTLTGTYTFALQDLTFLKNPSQARIINALDSLRAKVQPEDNLLIFYAGHGYWDEQMEQGFWLPADAERRFRSKWLANSTLRNYLRAIKVQHSLLVSDACFSGGIFKTRDAFSGAERAVTELYKLPSRKAMTSGTLKEVPDQSVFIKYLNQRLKENDRPYLTAQQLFNSLRDAVINNSPLGQVPQFGVVQETGDEGGEFVFRRRTP